MTKKIGVILSGCGFRTRGDSRVGPDATGARSRGRRRRCMAPNIEQAAVVDHTTGKTTSEKRNVLVESARIARRRIRDIATVDPNGSMASSFPVAGAATNLSDFASKARRRVDAGVRNCRSNVCGESPSSVCIAPGVIALLLGKHRVKLTIGSDAQTAKNLCATGAEHEPCVTEACVVDGHHRIVSTPAYMLGPCIRHIAAGIDLLVTEVVRMASEHERAPA